MRRCVTAGLMLAGLCAVAGSAVAALDATGADILGLRLDMTEPSVVLILHRQGVRQHHVVREAEPCEGPLLCRVTVTAATRDGDIIVQLSGDPARVDQIAYRFRTGAPEAPAIVVDAVVRHFGPPDEASPMTWCQPNAPDRGCADDRPRLRFFHQSQTLLLSGGRVAANGW
ncbi:MAG: hypothetical protein U1E70_17310 [Acetobacteraceae bacterium]